MIKISQTEHGISMVATYPPSRQKENFAQQKVLHKEKKKNTSLRHINIENTYTKVICLETK